MTLVGRAVALELVALELLAVVDVDEGEDLARGRVDALGRKRSRQEGRLLFREELPVAQMRGPLERREGLGRPVALQVGPAVGGARQRPLRGPVRFAADRILSGRGDRRQQPDRDKRDRRGNRGMMHLFLPRSARDRTRP